MIIQEEMHTPTVPHSIRPMFRPFSVSETDYLRLSLKARLHRRFLSQQLDAIFVALKLQLQNRTCKLGAIFIAICRRDIAGVSNVFDT